MMAAPIALQPSLFDLVQDPEPTEQHQPEPTRQQLLDSLEQLFQATEACCDLPEVVVNAGVTGVLSATPRSEHLCPGYAVRATAESHAIVLMIYRIAIV